MLTISNVNVYNLKEAVIASGNAFRINPVEINDEEFEKGLNRMIRLINTSNNSNIKSHHHALAGVLVSFDIRYPNYISPELQRYHFFEIISSSSKMHKLLQMNMDACFNEYVTFENKELMKKYIQEYNDINVNYNEPDKDDKLYKAWMKVLSNCPLGVELFMHVTTNYLQLQTMYFQRKHHRLKEDWGNFCKMVEELPYFNELILGKNGK